MFRGIVDLCKNGLFCVGISFSTVFMTWKMFKDPSTLFSVSSKEFFVFFIQLKMCESGLVWDMLSYTI